MSCAFGPLFSRVSFDSIRNPGLLRLTAFTVWTVLIVAGCATPSSVYQPELGRDTIRAVVRSHFRTVSVCYEEAIDARPGAMGKVMAEWDISPDGLVHNVVLSEVDPSLEAIKPCLTREISSWKFPQSTAKDETAVKYPFFFDERVPLK